MTTRDGVVTVGPRFAAWDFSESGERASIVVGRYGEGGHVYIDSELTFTDSAEDIERYVRAGLDGWMFHLLCWFLWGER